MIYAVSDIHGDLAMYNHIVKQLNKDDTLYVIGDAVDRGSSGIMILKDIMKRPNVEFLLGNHEWFLIMSMFYGYESIMNIWISKQSGGAVTAESLISLPSIEYDDILNYLLSRKICEKLTVNNKLFTLVHGCYYKGIEDVNAFKDSSLVYNCLWDSELLTAISDKNNTDIYVHGHVPIGNAGLNNPYLDNCRYIDGGNIFGGCQILYNLSTDTCTYFKNIDGKIQSKEVKNPCII